MRWRTPSERIGAVVHQALAVHALAGAGFVDKIDRDLLDHAGADASEHVLGCVPLDDDVIDAVLVQQLAEQQSGRSRADNGDLGTHGSPPGHGLLMTSLRQQRVLATEPNGDF